MSRPRRRRPRPPVRPPEPELPPTIGDPSLIPDSIKECMPPEGVIHDYVCWAVQETYAHPVYHLAAILPVAAYEAATRGWGGPWELPVRGQQGALQSFLIGAPASAKSTAMRKAREFHTDVMKRARGQLWQEKDDPWISAEGTVPGLLETTHALYDEELGITPGIFFHEEVSSLFGKGGEVTDVLMQLFDTIPIIKRNLVMYRRMREQGQEAPDTIHYPAMGGVLCGTYDSAERTLEASHFQGGLASRSLWFSGKPMMERYWDSAKDEVGRRALVTRWAHLGPRLAGRRLGGGAKLTQLTDECKAVLVPMFERMQKMVKMERHDEAAQLQRGMGMAQTIAGIYAMSCGRMLMSLSDMQAAAKLVELSQETAMRLAKATTEDVIFRKYEKVIARIRDAGEGGATRKELNHYGVRVSAGMFDQINQLLEESGDVFISKQPSGGRPTTRYIANEHLTPGDKVIAFPGLKARSERGPYADESPDGDDEGT